MSDPIRRTKRVTQLQKGKLIQFMAQHSDLSSNIIRGTTIGEQRHLFLWRKLTEGLNSLGPSKSIEQWKVTWRDLKRNAKLAKLKASRFNTKHWMLNSKQQSSSSADDVNDEELESDNHIDDIVSKESNDMGDIIIVPTSHFSDHQYESTPCYIKLSTSTSQHKSKDYEDPLRPNIKLKEYTDEDEVFDNKELNTNNEPSPKGPDTSWIMKLEERRIANEEKLTEATVQIAQAASQMARAGVLNAESSQTMAQATLLLAQNQQTLIDMLKANCKEKI